MTETEKTLIVDFSQAPSYRTVSIAFALIRKGELLVCTHERDGWYLPAGRVDFGETFTTGGIREALEETDLPVNLTSIHCIQFSPGVKNVRLRIFFGAEPKDNTPTKSVPNHEIIAAEWLPLNKILNLQEVRSSELYYIADKVLSNKVNKFPINFLEGTDGNEIDHQECVANLAFGVKLVILDEKQDFKPQESKVLVMKREEELLLVQGFMHKPTTFLTYANNLAVIFGIKDIKITGTLKLKHIAPPTKSLSGSLVTTFLAKVPSKSSFHPVDNITLTWVSYQELISPSSKLIDGDKTFLQSFPSLQVLTPELFVLEGEGFK